MTVGASRRPSVLLVARLPPTAARKEISGTKQQASRPLVPYLLASDYRSMEWILSGVIVRMTRT
jgi:hypothetical protein